MCNFDFSLPLNGTISSNTPDNQKRSTLHYDMTSLFPNYCIFYILYFTKNEAYDKWLSKCDSVIKWWDYAFLTHGYFHVKNNSIMLGLTWFLRILSNNIALHVLVSNKIISLIPGNIKQIPSHSKQISKRDKTCLLIDVHVQPLYALGAPGRRG